MEPSFQSADRSEQETHAKIAVSCKLCIHPSPARIFTVARNDLGGIAYEVFRCPSCDFVFAQGPVSDALMERIYSRFFYASGQQSVPHRPDGSLAEGAEHWPALANARTRVKWLQNQGWTGKLLDIGAGRGYFVYCAARSFEATGLEIQPEAVAFGQKFGVSLAQGDVLTAELPHDYNLLTLWDVFAGFTEPKTVLARLLSLVRPGGHIVMTVPDASSLTARLLRQSWPLMIPPGNMQFYSPKSLSFLLDHPDIAGYSISYQAKAVNLRFLLHKLVRAVGLHRLAQTQWPIPARWKVPLNLYDIMTVVITRKA